MACSRVKFTFYIILALLTLCLCTVINVLLLPRGGEYSGKRVAKGKGKAVPVQALRVTGC